MCKPVSLLLLIVGCLLLLSGSIHAQFSISINYPPALADTAITRLAITDVTQLLQQACQCPVTHNEPAAADVYLNLPDINPSAANQPTALALRAGFPYKHYPAHHFSWQQTVLDNGKQTNLTLNANTLQGVSFGLYALLQELLGFAFYHPKQTYVPNLKEWILKDNFTWSGAPLFDKKGFHLHTQHPIELTEPLLNPNYPNALEEVKTYIDWLVRNGQNYFEFCLLNSINRPLWVKHAQQICHYAHSRGIFIAVDVSLHMIQQKTFQLYEEPVRKKKQITQNLQWLMQAPWDFINMEFSTAEFIPGNTQKKEQLRLFIITWLQANAPNTKLMGRQHVVQEKQPHTKPILPDSATLATDQQRGILAHTVMFYNMTEPNAPVYQNQNQRHMYRFMLQQHQIRETWYYPESAYWITFDNSVPMLLLPYLQARLADIDTCVAHQIPGHITFSSGWEWGYWLIDWSIARWSWQYALNNIPQLRYPEMYAHKLPAKNAQLAFTLLLQLQQQYLKDSSLMQWMTAMTVTDEIPIKSLANAYHPRPTTSYPFLRNKASAAQLQTVQHTVIPQLDNFAGSALQLVQVLNDANNNQPADTFINHLNQELADGLHITALRAIHRAQILRYLTAHRQAKLNRTPFTGHSYLHHAANIRQQALQIVKRRENHYRYPLPLLTHKQPDHTAYHFGYLYPVTNLHFWHREEQQAKQNQYHPAFMNIWQVGRIIGLKK